MSYRCRWIFTINNYKVADCHCITAFLIGPDVVLGCVACEVGQSDTPHIQGFVHLVTRVALNQMLD
jgi:hypothetical protein